jgi:hypothetical protein
VVAQYTAQEVYTSREAIQERVRDNARKGLGANLNKLVQPEAMEQPDPRNYNDALQYSIQIIDTLVLSIELPPAIVAAINRQTEQFYLIQEYRYRVEREAQESRRKQIEANGIAAFQQTVGQGITDSYLRWRGIEATLALSQSQNSKIVVIGGGKDGLPIILGNVDQPNGPATPPRRDAVPPPPPPTETVPGAYGPAQPVPRAFAPQAAPTSPTTVVVQPGGAVQVNPPPSAQPQQGPTPPAPDKRSSGPEPAGKPDKAAEKPATFNPFDLSSYEAVLSRLTGGSRTTGSATGAEGPAKPAEVIMRPAEVSTSLPPGTR